MDRLLVLAVTAGLGCVYRVPFWPLLPVLNGPDQHCAKIKWAVYMKRIKTKCV